MWPAREMEIIARFTIMPMDFLPNYWRKPEKAGAMTMRVNLNPAILHHVFVALKMRR